MASIDLKNPTTQKFVLSMVLSGALLGAFFFTHYLPFSFPNQRDKVKELKVEYEKKSTELARARATVADLPRFEAEYAHLHERWATAAELLPTERQLAALLRKITLAAQQSGVRFQTFRPDAARPDQHYTELPLQLSVQGSYHQVGSFLAELANMRRIITVSNLQLKAYGPATKAHMTTAAEFTASAYSLNAASAAPEPAAAPPKGGEPHEKKS